ncbi:MAG: ABC transporter permease [Candidatus Aminicenantes bacterium]|nr:ABC transporter permease [Candidatus Aminicenantes bacterium]
MFWNHLKTAIRILRKQRLTAVINVAGLAIGLAFFALLVAYVRDELTFDRFHAKADRTYVLTSEFRDRFIGGSHHFIAEMLEREYPEVKPGSAVRYAMHTQTIRLGDRLVVKDFAFSDPGFFGMFSFNLVAGHSSQALTNPHNVVITAASARALGIDPNPLGQILAIRIGERYQDFVVSGIIDDIPGNSSLRFDGILPFSQVFDAYQIDKNNNDFVTLPIFATTFLDLPDAETAASLRAKLPALSDRLYGAMWKRVKMDPPKRGFDLLKLPDYHLGDVDIFAFVSRSRPAYSLTLSGIALLILILACFNSVNLSLAQNSARWKEIGVRKVIGARKGQLVGQFLIESLLSGLAALILGLLAAALLVSSFNGLTGKRLGLDGLLHPQTLAVMVTSVLVVCVFIGFFPAQALSRFPAAEVFRGHFPGGRKGRLSLGLIVFQFTVSLVFLIGSLVMARQLRFMAKADLGYDPSNIIIVDTQVPAEAAPEAVSLLEVFRNELRSDVRVLAISADSGTVGTRYGGVTRRYDKDGVEHTVEAFQVDRDYLRLLNLPLVMGRGFSFERAADAREGIIVNEALVKDFELENPVGMRFSDFAQDKFPPEYTFDPVIIGVVRDFHVSSLHEIIEPMGFGLRGFPPLQRFRNILIKTRPGEMAAVGKSLEAIWAKVRPDVPFSHRFLDDALAWEYRRDRNWSRIVWWAGGFSLFIACLGLFGLTAISVVRRTKETGVRRVLGAGVSDILFLFSRDILRWVVVATLLSWPIAYLAARKWLELFAYRIDLDIWMFAGVAVLALFVAGLTVSGQALRAARSDPARSLRYE